MDELNVPDFGTQPELNLGNLEFHSGDSTFGRAEFIEEVAPYFEDLKRVNRTNFLCVFTYGNGDKTDVTGYQNDTTLDVTNNSKILKSRKTNGSWVVYQLNS